MLPLMTVAVLKYARALEDSCEDMAEHLPLKDTPVIS